MNPQTQVDLVGPKRVGIDPELLKAAIRGDKNLLLKKLLPSVVIAVGGASAPQDQPVSILLGVTIGGNTVLHIAATHGHLELAKIICQRESSLVVARNVMRETPLHCAASAGHHQIVSSIISFTRDSNQFEVETVLRARNQDWGTALHEAVRNGHVEVAKLLMIADPGLANMVDEEGISPLYLAAMVGSLPLICAILPPCSTTSTAVPFQVSYAGPNGQTALHAAAAALPQKSEIAQELLKWNNMLAKVADKSGSTPLHYAASAGNDEIVELLLKDDSSLAYISDSDGLFPVHAAAITSKVKIIEELIKHCPDLDELLDKKERNLLHTAVEHTSKGIVRYVCGRSELVKLMNARDYEGNTPLHLAVKKGHRCNITLLMGNKRVNLNILNKEGLTPLDLAIIRDEYGLTTFLNTPSWIRWCLADTGALASPGRVDHFIRDNIIWSDLEKESKKQMQMNQSLVIVSVLIATVTFAAAFTMPTSLARRYTFKAFILADTAAFIFSILSTCWVTFGASILDDPRWRSQCICRSYRFLVAAMRSMVAAFALGTYLVLSPVSNSTGIVVCVAASVSLLFDTPEKIRLYRLAMTIKSRVGWSGLFKFRVLPHGSIPRIVFFKLLFASLYFIFIYLLALL